MFLRKKVESVKELLQKREPEEIKVLVNFSRPSNRFGKQELKDIILWEFGDVFEIGGKDTGTAVVEILKKYCGLSERQIMKGKASQFVSLMKHIQNEFEKIQKLMSQLESEPDADMVNAGAEKMNRFGVLSIYHSIDKNPLQWDKISETEFIKIYMRLLIDKTQGEIQRSYQQLQAAKQKTKHGHS